MDSAVENVEMILINKAIKICKSEGFESIYDDKYKFRELINWSESDCKENTRLGSTFYYCRGDASYRCGVPLER